MAKIAKVKQLFIMISHVRIGSLGMQGSIELEDSRLKTRTKVMFIGLSLISFFRLIFDLWEENREIQSQEDFVANNLEEHENIQTEDKSRIAKSFSSMTDSFIVVLK